ncbi:hypothetical protein ACJ72_03130 [Emergomyces africanus]|uniref:Uncharacterized protein n=1 Tax=Emergomyces africanus TaxID=1955775 RepID=A0A1B7P0G8_9EURO|nr:hypothetical protein ACJ72_03130 [Emergomyces africanus]
MEKARMSGTGSKTPLWEKALENYREELAEKDDYKWVLENQGTLDELMKFTNSLEWPGLRDRSVLNSLKRLKPILKFVNDFSAVIALYFGADTALTAVIWGSLKLILTLASSAEDSLRDMLDMLEELSLTLPRFKTYEETLPMDTALESSLLAVYSEVICFYARAIHFFRSRKHVILRENAWAELRGDFTRTTLRIKRLSAAVEREADLARLRTEKDKYHEVLMLISDIKRDPAVPTIRNKLSIPYSPNPRFWARQDALDQVDKALDPSKPTQGLQSFALYGMGGVGKTQIALQYATSGRGKFDAVMWVAADTLITMAQSFREAARNLGIIDLNQDSEDNAVSMKVKSWLCETDEKWLLVLDNADDLSIIKHALPNNNKGSVLLTTRNFNGAIAAARNGFHVQPFDEETGAAALLNFLNLDPKSEMHLENAKAIASTLGGLPLALSQIGGFVTQRRIALHEFLPLYRRNTSRIDAKKNELDDYRHTLNTVWKMSLEKLSGTSKMLQMLLAFFDPDMIHVSVLTEGGKMVEDEEFEFLTDELDLLDAEQPLLQAALIEKNDIKNHISIHRLIQTAILRKMTSEERARILTITVTILSWGFPDTFSADVGHQVSSWDRCDKCLPHIDHLVRQVKFYSLEPRDKQAYAELILRCSWHLYEKEYYEQAQEYVQEAIHNFIDKSTAAYASAVDLSGLIELDLNNTQNALNIFKEALKIREAIFPPNDPFLAASEVNLGLAYTELNDLEKAYQKLQRSAEIRQAAQSDRLTNSYSNMSSLLIRMGKPDEAEEMLKRCPALKDLSDDEFFRTGNPRFSGNMIVLSRIRFAQGRHDDALRIASKALSFRRSMLGNRLKICDSLYHVAGFLEKQGNEALAIELLDECATIAENLPRKEGVNHLARAKNKLSMIFDAVGKKTESQDCGNTAVQLMAEIRAMQGVPFDMTADIKPVAFESLVPWMLW